ncbi:MAG: DUF5597 domain-containing protein, partial [Clostridia bacterium]|nr:DUF5597 domain-containing protein [Clostridia bacterium]
IAVAWERFEAREGEFDTRLVKEIIRKAREQGLKLVFLWFGAWKNGHMKYSPEWVKTDHKRFWRVRTHDGYQIANLSSFCEETHKADCRAFCKLMETIREEDEIEKTVLAVQIQNELGIVGRTVRDFGEVAQAAYEANVPQEVIDALKSGNECDQIVREWKECGAVENGNWWTLFGRRGDELLQTYSMACYVDKMAVAGKSIYNVPMYTNVWQQGGFEIPGTDYPSGEAVMKNLAFWRWFAPNLDMICPDVYISAQSQFQRICHTYNRDDNPLYIPETGAGMPHALGTYRAIAEDGLTGVHIFGAESLLDENWNLKESARPMHENFQCMNAIAPLLAKYRGTDKIHAVIQEEFAMDAKIYADGWQLRAVFGDYARGGDYRHGAKQDAYTKRGRGLVIQTDKNEFFVCGSAFTLQFRTNPHLTRYKVPQQDYQFEHALDYLHVEEGHFDAEGNWVVDRIRNGDQTDFAVFVYPDNGAVRVVLEDMLD